MLSESGQSISDRFAFFFSKNMTSKFQIGTQNVTNYSPHSKIQSDLKSNLHMTDYGDKLVEMLTCFEHVRFYSFHKTVGHMPFKHCYFLFQQCYNIAI